jgi:hypothetical protein
MDGFRKLAGASMLPPIVGAQLFLDFVKRQYYFGSSWRPTSDFAAFTLGGSDSFGDTGLSLAGAGAHNISIAWDRIGIQFPFAMIAGGTPQSVLVTQFLATGFLDTSNHVGIRVNNLAARGMLVQTAGATEAHVNSTPAVTGTRLTIGGNFETNNALCSIDGASAGTPDAAVTLPAAPTALNIGERNSTSQAWNGTVHHVVIIPGYMTQTQLNFSTAAVHKLLQSDGV